MKENPTKAQIWAEVIPGFKETYRFGSELEYYQMYQAAKFGFTWKKGGWDCLRHYEIIANGAIPVFRDIDHCPESSLTNLPKNLFKRVNSELIPWRNMEESEKLYQTLLGQIREYCLENTTSEATATKILKILDLSSSCSVLLLTCDLRVNYSREFTFIGLNRVLKENGGVCVSYPELSPAYRDFPEDESLKLYGKGFGYTRRLERSHPSEFRKWTDEQIRKSIIEKEWDYVLFGKVGYDEFAQGRIPSLPFWDEVNSVYTRDQIGFLYGGDSMQDLSDKGSRHTRHLLKHAKFGSCFVRELAP
ncbi:hypothetical protein J0A67_03540 [Algoriphagus aestuariicola]|uniref:Uncharacterized protein n=1 Tax=Algoriphagus aestuariicola TaxID=1852016 RepID=A0ABS3BKT7_9BACT|nr:hypothetical protein [Algoriphagus aestuariicola]MBN7799916.1 hypothetical protein [Algoriphagus aestuariicola]